MLGVIEILLIILGILCLIWVFSPFMEGFNDQGNIVSIDKYYISPDRNIRLSRSGAIMWVSNLPPSKEGVEDCQKVPCPAYYGGFDNMDTCWKCGSDREITPIPDIHPHVKV